MAVKYEEDEKPEIQMTSMMDCIFLMLIFFLVSSQLKKIEREVPLTLPESDVAVSVGTEPDLLKVSVTEKGELYVGGKPVGPGGLRSALQEAVAEKPGRKVRLDGDIYAPFRSVVQVLEACRLENLDVVGIHTAEGKPGKPGK